MWERNQEQDSMGIAAYEISGHGKEWRIHQKVGERLRNQGAAFEAAVAAASFAMRAGYEIRIQNDVESHRSTIRAARIRVGRPATSQ